MLELPWYAYVMGVVLGMLMSMAFGYFVVAPRARNLLCDALGLSPVEVNGETVFALLDQNGEPIKAIVGFKEDADGKQVPIMGYAPFMWTFAGLIVDNSAAKLKMALLGAKGNVSKAIKGRLTEEVAAGRLDADVLMPHLPKKAQAAIALVKALGLDLRIPGAPDSRLTSNGGARGDLQK
jgi:hypothetical protein